LFSVVLWVVRWPEPSLPEPFHTAVAFLLMVMFGFLSPQSREDYASGQKQINYVLISLKDGPHAHATGMYCVTYAWLSAFILDR
jgi:hypothetical protein